MAKIWIKQGAILTASDEQPALTGHIVIDGDRIEYVGADEPAHTGPFDETIDGRGKLFMPGLVNTHGHAAMSLLRGYADDLALQVWLEDKMWPNEAKFTAEDVQWATMLSIAEMIRSGTTTFVDMYDHMDEVAKAVERTGMRGCLTRGMIGFAPEDVQRAKLAEGKAFARNWHGQADGRITAMMAPHAPYTCPPAFIEKVVDIAHELDLPIHTHMSETLREVLDNERQYGSRPVAHLEKLGVFSRPCLVAHGVHLNDEEIETLARHDVRISHNPGSNLKLASGIARVPELRKAGVLVSLGTDSSASNNNLDMFEEMRLAALLHKGVSGDPTAVPAEEALKMATAYGAQSIWLPDTGQLRAGCKADLIALDIDQPHYYPRTNLLSHVVYSGMSSDVTDVWVDGRRLLKDREYVTLDVERVQFEFAARFEALMNR